MRERGGEVDLAQEPLAAERLGEVVVEDLDGDVAVVLEVAGEVDGRHAAGAELALDAVVGGERRRQVRRGHAGRWGRRIEGGRVGRAFAYLSGMSIPRYAVTDESDLDTLRDEIRSATELLERIIADRGLLAAIPKEERDRLRDAVALVYHPDAKARRTMVKATTRQRKAAAVRKEEEVLEERGIRSLRRQSVFNTPNVFPPASSSSRPTSTTPTSARPWRSGTATSARSSTPRSITSTTSSAPPAATSTSRSAPSSPT